MTELDFNHEELEIIIDALLELQQQILDGSARGFNIKLINDIMDQIAKNENVKDDLREAAREIYLD